MKIDQESSDRCFAIIEKEIGLHKLPRFEIHADLIEPDDRRQCLYWVREDEQGEYEMRGMPAWDAVQELLATCATEENRAEILAGTLILVDWNAIWKQMDEELRKELHAQLAPCSEEAFLVAYLEKHREKFGEDFELP